MFVKPENLSRQIDGIAKAKQKGVRFGAQKKLTDKQIEEMKQRRAEGVLIKILMKDYQLSKASVYRYLESPIEGEKLSGKTAEIAF